MVNAAPRRTLRIMLSLVLCAAVLVPLATATPMAVASIDSEHPPTWPVGASISVGTVGTTTAQLSWTAAEDNSGYIDEYRVYLNGSGTPYATPSTNSVSLTGLTPGTHYDVRIEAVDGSGSASSPSNGFSLSPRHNWSMGQNPHSVKAEDVNGDGDVDLIVAAAGSDGVTIRLGDGNGGFGPQLGPFRSGNDVGSHEVYPKNAVVADFDKDGDADLVVANQNSSSIGILIGNGNGTFQSVDEYDTCSGAHDVAVGEFTGDSDVDVVVACHGRAYITLYEGDRDGTFSNRSDIATGAPDIPGCVAPPLEGNCDHGIVAGDFNGPGADDVAIAMYRPIYATVMLGNGNGTFQSPVNYTAEGHTHDIATGDFDGDGYPDLVTANESADSASVFINDGDGTFSAGPDLPAANGPKGVTVGDINGDGHPDIAIGSDGGNYPLQQTGGGDFVTLWLGDGDGTFTLAGDYGN
ncbi:MAG: VCBS repeat-containing protein, partial [Acidimicrobiia bacterium]|nr:VCBS repeat-containing protein [Acidimicrobiia bacterium]